MTARIRISHVPQIDATNRIPTPGERALVLGGGGSTGNAWNIGVIAGLLDAGLDVTDADLVVGTSAGATAAAQLTGADPTALLAAIMSGPSRSSGPAAPIAHHLERMRALIAASADVADLRRRLAAAALDLHSSSDGTWQARWRTTVAARLPSHDWPERPMVITAVDIDSGEPIVFDRHSGVDLVDAVAASCSNGFGVPAYIIDGRHYLDGGYRSNAENADLAAGYQRVLVLSPFGGRSLHPEHWGTHLATQVDQLRADGSTVETVFPDATFEHLFGASAMDVSQRPAAARAGYDRGHALAATLVEFWR